MQANPCQAAAPQPPQVELSGSTTTSSLVDVDQPSVRTVPSDFADQPVQTETQADRLERESAAAATAAKSPSRRPSKRPASGDDDLWAKALAASNVALVLALGGWLGFKAWGLRERGRLGWREIGVGAGILAAAGAAQGVVARYFRELKSKKN